MRRLLDRRKKRWRRAPRLTAYCLLIYYIAAQLVVRARSNLRLKKRLNVSWRKELESSSPITIATLLKGSETEGTVEATLRTQNSVTSLGRLPNVDRVILFVDHDMSCSSLSQEYAHTICSPLSSECMSTMFQRPTMGCLFRKLKRLAQTEIVLYVNGDIVLFDSIIFTIELLNKSFHRFVLVGRRHDVSFNFHITQRTKESDMVALEERTLRKGKVHGVYGIDYFALRRSDIPEDLPEFVTGAWKWDNTLLAMLLMRNVSIVDGSDCVTALHQGVHSKSGSRHTVRVGASENSDIAYTKLRSAYIAGRTDFSDEKVSIVDRDIRVEKATQLARYTSFIKCVLRATDTVQRVYIISVQTNTIHGKWRDAAKELRSVNYITVTTDTERANTLIRYGVNVCNLARSPLTRSEYDLPPAEALLEVLFLGYDAVLMTDKALFTTGIRDLERFSFPASALSVHNFGSASMIHVSADEHGTRFLSRVGSCQRKIVRRISRMYQVLRLRQCAARHEKCRRMLNTIALDCFTRSLSKY